MKKLVFAAVAAIALTASVSFVACNNAPAAADTAAIDSAVVDSTVAVADTAATDTTAADSVVAE